MHIACLHTADVHVATFRDLFAERAPDIHVTHVVRADVLAQAQVGGLDVVAEAVFNEIAALQSADVILCTCSTLGPLIDQLSSDKVIRIDRPMMETAATLGHRPLMAICLESTVAPSLALLKEYDPQTNADVVMCAGAWPLFLAGDTAGFAASITVNVSKAVDGHDCIILAQASMRVAESALKALGIPVLTSPGMAADAAIGKALA